jgi:hypothetical protein
VAVPEGFDEGQTVSGFAGSAAEHPTGDMSIYDEDFITSGVTNKAASLMWALREPLCAVPIAGQPHPDGVNKHSCPNVDRLFLREDEPFDDA